MTGGMTRLQPTASQEVAPLREPSLGELFAGFLGIGLFGFGGVLPWARRMVVEQRRWLTGAEFTDLLALCQFLPGPNVVNLAVALGARFRGAAGSLAALAGLLAAPVCVVILLGMAYGRYGHIPAVRHGFAGLSAAASGLVAAMAAKIAWPMRARPEGAAVALCGFALIALLRLPLLPTMLGLVPVSVGLAWALRLRGRA